MQPVSALPSHFSLKWALGRNAMYKSLYLQKKFGFSHTKLIWLALMVNTRAGSGLDWITDREIGVYCNCVAEGTAALITLSSISGQSRFKRLAWLDSLGCLGRVLRANLANWAKASETPGFCPRFLSTRLSSERRRLQYS